jgi:predicted metal-dependent phosphoesterase TrpH
LEKLQVDLHLHTTASDGTWTAKQLVDAALRKRIGMMAVTDHETTDNVLEAEYYAKKASIKFIRGAEISSTEGTQIYHILGYHFDLNNKRLQELLQHTKNLLEKQDEKTVIQLVKKGWEIDLKDYANYKYDRRLGGWKSLNYLIEKGHCKNVTEFFQKIFTKENQLGFPIFPSIPEVIDTIHHAGGIALLAHGGSNLHGPGLLKTMAKLGKYEFDGFECYHPNHTDEVRDKLLAYCLERNLLISGGSDCHGDFVNTRNIGEPCIYEDMLKLK